MHEGQSFTLVVQTLKSYSGLLWILTFIDIEEVDILQGEFWCVDFALSTNSRGFSLLAWNCRIYSYATGRRES